MENGGCNSFVYAPMSDKHVERGQDLSEEVEQKDRRKMKRSVIAIQSVYDVLENQ